MPLELFEAQADELDANDLLTQAALLRYSVMAGRSATRCSPLGRATTPPDHTPREGTHPARRLTAPPRSQATS